MKITELFESKEKKSLSLNEQKYILSMVSLFIQKQYPFVDFNFNISDVIDYHPVLVIRDTCDECESESESIRTSIISTFPFVTVNDNMHAFISDSYMCECMLNVWEDV
jgi:hypothetical protein